MFQEPKGRTSRSKKKLRRWLKEEDDLLSAAVDRLGDGNWKLIAEYVCTRDAASCYQRWNRAICPKINRKPFTRDEIQKLHKAIAEHGEHRWSVVANALPGRTDTQCRSRWREIKKKMKISTPRRSTLGTPDSEGWSSQDHSHCMVSDVRDFGHSTFKDDEKREEEDTPLVGIAHDAAAHFGSPEQSFLLIGTNSEGSDSTDLPIGLQLCFGSVLEVWDNIYFHQPEHISQTVDS